MEFFFFDGGCLGKVTGSKVEVVLWVVSVNFGVLLEVVILV